MAKSRTVRLLDAVKEIRNQLNVVTELRDEVEEWMENMEDTEAEDSPRYSKLEDLLCQLDDFISEVDVACDTIEPVQLPRS